MRVSIPRLLRTILTRVSASGPLPINVDSSTGYASLPFSTFHASEDEKTNLPLVMATWADDEEIVCIHPGGPRLVGFEAIRNAWEQLFSGDVRLRFRIEQPIAIDTVGLAVQSAIEHVFLADGSSRGMAVATNVFMRTPTGWRMVCHHSSPAPAVAAPAPAGPLH